MSTRMGVLYLIQIGVSRYQVKVCSATMKNACNNRVDSCVHKDTARYVLSRSK